MKRIILDTSVYGELIKEADVVSTLARLVPADYVVYGTRIIRNELRDIAKEARIEGKSKRNLLLRVYDSLVKKDHHDLDIIPLIEIIASEFYKKYREDGGAKSLKEMINDLRIVACAAFYNLDVVVSNDEKSMLSEHALAAYRKVCKEFSLHIPEFIPYRKFREMIIHD
mgnify:CR=1 FL=1